MRSSFKNRVIGFILSVIMLAVAITAIINISMDYSKNKAVFIEKNEAFKEIANGIDNIRLSLEKMKKTENIDEMLVQAETILKKTKNAKGQLKKINGFETGSSISRFLQRAEGLALRVVEMKALNEDFNNFNVYDLELISSTAEVINNVISERGGASDKITFEEKLYLLEQNDIINENFNILYENDKSSIQIIYDAPFSQVSVSGEASYLLNKPIFTESDALNAALLILGDSVKGLEFVEVSNSFAEIYIFGGSDVRLSLTKKGGYIAEFERRIKNVEKVLSEEKSIEIAKGFISAMEFKNMVPSFTYYKNGVFYTNFVFLDGQTLCYSDLIRVGISADDGDLVYFNSVGFLANNKERAFPVSNYTKQDAANKINDEINVEKTAIVLIATDDGREERCYEFLCKGEEKEKLLVYINVLNLEAEKILIFERQE